MYETKCLVDQISQNQPCEVDVQGSKLQGPISSVLPLQMLKSGWKKFVLFLVPLPQETEQGLQSDHPICGPQSTKHVTSDQL